MDEPGQRSSHERKIPNLGGIALFFAISVSASIFAYQLFDLYKFLFASLVILLYIGVMVLYVTLMYFNFAKSNGSAGNFTPKAYRNVLWK